MPGFGLRIWQPWRSAHAPAPRRKSESALQKPRKPHADPAAHQPSTPQPAPLNLILPVLPLKPQT
eukprot:354411-Chlamydomonas_euryale.AAC.1